MDAKLKKAKPQQAMKRKKGKEGAKMPEGFLKKFVAGRKSKEAVKEGKEK